MNIDLPHPGKPSVIENIKAFIFMSILYYSLFKYVISKIFKKAKKGR